MYNTNVSIWNAYFEIYITYKICISIKIYKNYSYIFYYINNNLQI